MSVNKVIIVGNLKESPECNHTSNGIVCKFTVPTTDTWYDKVTKEKKEATEWHNIVVFGKLAEICNQYLEKRSKVYVEGRLKTTQKDKRYYTNIHAHTVQFLTKGQNTGKKDSTVSNLTKTVGEAFPELGKIELSDSALDFSVTENEVPF